MDLNTIYLSIWQDGQDILSSFINHHNVSITTNTHKILMNSEEQIPKDGPSVTWHVYIVCCKDASLYTGITTDLLRRIDEHNSSKNGARYTRSRRPVELVYFENAASRSIATRRENQIKKLTPVGKKQLIKTCQPLRAIVTTSPSE